MDLSVFSAVRPEPQQVHETPSKSTAIHRMSETLLSFLPKKSNNASGNRKKEATMKMISSIEQPQQLRPEPSLEDLTKKRRKSKKLQDTTNSVHWQQSDESLSQIVSNLENQNYEPHSVEHSPKRVENNKRNKGRRGSSSPVKYRKQFKETDKAKAHRKRLCSSEIVRAERFRKENDRLKMELDKCREMYEIKLMDAIETHSRAYKKLREENEVFYREKTRLEEALKTSKPPEHQTVTTTKLEYFKNENKNLKEDYEIYKSVIQRLNKQIQFYQDKLRLKYKENPSLIPVFSSSEETINSYSKEDLDNPVRTFRPLFQAYDEIIAEKNDIIKENEVKMEGFKLTCQEIVKENQDLHEVIRESKVKGTVSIADWLSLREDALIVLDSAEALNEKKIILERKLNLVQSEHATKVSRLKTKLSILEDEKARLQSRNSELENHCTNFLEQKNKMTAMIRERIPKAEYETRVGEVEKWFSELKDKYQAEKTESIEKLAALSGEKDRLVAELTDSESENEKLKAKVRHLEASIRTMDDQIKKLQAKHSETAKTRDDALKEIHELKDLVKLAIDEKEAIQILFNEKTSVNQEIMAIRSRESELVADLRKQIEVISAAHKQEIEGHAKQINDFDDVLQTIAERHQIELTQLRERISHKIRQVEKLQTEKMQLIEDLETVWRATAKDRGDAKSNTLKKPEAVDVN